MTVIGTFRVDIRPYSGYSDPGLPIASWIAQGGIAGDASGNQVLMDFLFQRNDDAQISELFNLEMISADISTVNSVDMMIETRNMDNLAPNRPVTDQRWMSGVRAGSGLGGVAAFEILSTILPLWLGSPNRVEGDSGIRITWDNVDLRLYLVTLQGYMWGPRSVLTDGGPRRPVGGLFGG